MKKIMMLTAMSLLLVACSEENSKSNPKPKEEALVAESESVTTEETTSVTAEDAKQFLEQHYTYFSNNDLEKYASQINEEKLIKYKNITRDKMVQLVSENFLKKGIESVDYVVTIEKQYDENTFYYKVVLKYSNGESEDIYGTVYYQNGNWEVDLTNVVEEQLIQNISSPIADVGTFETTDGKMLKLTSGSHLVTFNFKINSQNGIAFGWTEKPTFTVMTSEGEITGNLQRENFMPNTNLSYTFLIEKGIPEKITVNQVYLLKNNLAIPGLDPIKLEIPVEIQ